MTDRLDLKFDVWTLAAAFCAIPLSRMKTSLEDAYQWDAPFLKRTARGRGSEAPTRILSKKSKSVATTSTHSLDGQKNSSKSDHRRILPLFRQQHWSRTHTKISFFADDNNSRYAAIDRDTARRSFFTPETTTRRRPSRCSYALRGALFAKRFLQTVSWLNFM